MVDHGDLVVGGHGVQDLLGRAGVVVIVLRLVRQPEAAALADLLELRSVGKGVVDLVDRVAGHAEDLPVLHIDIDAAAEQTQVCRDLERLVSGELARPGGQGRGAGQIGALIAGQRRGIAGQAEADLEIRHRVHQRVEHVALHTVLTGVGHLRAERGVVDEQARVVARGVFFISGGQTRVDALFKCVLVDVLRPARADIARAVFPEQDEQHLCQLPQRHMIGGAEAAVAAGDDLVLRAVGDERQRPGLRDVIERDGGILPLGLGVRVGEQGHELGDLFAADQLVRAEAAVRIAGDETEVGEHPHGVVVPDRAPVGKVCGLGRGAGQDQQPRKHSRKQQTEKLFQDVSLLPAGKMTKRSVSP